MIDRARYVVVVAGVLVGVASACSVLTNLDDLKGGDAGGGDAAPDVVAIDASADADAAANTGPAIDGSAAFASHWPTSSTTGSGAASIAPLPSGGYVIGGDYSGSNAVIGPYVLPASNGGGRDAYLITLDANGNPTGALGFGGTGSDSVISVTADSAGFIYAVGTTMAGGTINGTSLGAGTFIVKLDSKNLAAAPAWTRSFELSIACTRCLEVTGNTLTAGVVFLGTITYDSGKFVTSAGGFDALLIEMNASSGMSTWAGQISGTGDDIVEALARGPLGALYVVADSSSPTLSGVLGARSPTGPGSKYNLLAAKLDPSHAPVWVNAYGDPGGTGIVGGGIAPDNAGHVAVGGTFFGGVDFGLGVTGASASSSIVFVIDEAQNKTIWQQPITPSANHLNGLAVDAWGHILATGTYVANIKIGSTNLMTAAGSEGSYLAKFGPPVTYAPEWAAPFPELADSGATVWASAVTIAPNGTPVVSGALSGTGDLGLGPVTAGSPQDSFVAGRLP